MTNLSEGDQEFSFCLDHLPVLVIECIADHLSTKDLASCCAVSRGVREAFDIDQVWGSRYDKKRAEYLWNTPCKVQPIFESPEMAINHNLCVISQQRLGFMLENHLWNNWRRGNYMEEVLWPIPPEDDLCYGKHLYSRFLTDDYVMSVFLDRIEIIDIRDSPPSRAFKPIGLPDPTHWPTLVRIACGKIIVLLTTCVQVYFVYFATKQTRLKHSFLIDGDMKILVDSLMWEDPNYFQGKPQPLFTIVDDFIIGVAGNRGVMHIWNLQTGNKIKEEVCPSHVMPCAIQQILCSSSKDLILSVQVGEDNNTSLLIVYNLTVFKFEPVEIRLSGTVFDSYDYKMFGNFIAVWDDELLNIYDYKKNVNILQNHCFYGEQQPLNFRGVVALHEDKCIKFFDPLTLKTHKLDFAYPINMISVLSNRFILVQTYDGVKMTNDLLEIDVTLKCYKKASFGDFIYGSPEYCLKKVHTEYIFRTKILHFW